MALVTPTNYEYDQTVVDKTKAYVAKRAPGILAKVISLTMYGLFQAFRFLGDVVRDAFNK